jgi:hypothetical protein
MSIIVLVKNRKQYICVCVRACVCADVAGQGKGDGANVAVRLALSVPQCVFHLPGLLAGESQSTGT